MQYTCTDTYVMSNQLPFLLFLSFHTFAYFFLPPQNTHTQYRYPQAGTDPTASVLHQVSTNYTQGLVDIIVTTVASATSIL